MKNKKHEMLILIMTIGITISGCVIEKRMAPDLWNPSMN